ncbi:MAG: hypothetical protein IT189_03085 [Microbacteriaceae bacterium]|nr:hypothetical protein [Microbacteriaceae bacterium]
MSWVFPVSEAARTTRLGVVAAFVWTGVALLIAGAAATFVVGLSWSGVPWLALGGFAVAAGTLIVARRFESGGPVALVAAAAAVLACWMVAVGIRLLDQPFDGYVGFPLFAVGVAATLAGAIADRWSGAIGTLIGFAAGQAALVLAYRGAVPAAVVIDPATAAVAGVVALFISMLSIVRRRARATGPRLDDSGRQDLEARERQSLLLNSRALVHDTVLGELAALGMTRPGPLTQSMATSIRASLVAAASAAEPLADPGLPPIAFADLLTRFRVAGLNITVTGDQTALDLLSADRRASLVLAMEQCLVNVLQHSGVNHAELSVAVSEGRLIATVVDEGSGFDQGAVPADRFGLRESIRGRIAELGGAVRVLSGAGTGTSVIVSVPLDEGSA